MSFEEEKARLDQELVDAQKQVRADFHLAPKVTEEQPADDQLEDERPGKH